MLHLLQTLWPGDWKKQLGRINDRIATTNKVNEDKRRSGVYDNQGKATPKAKFVSMHEFWVFWGLMLYSSVEKAKGKIWEKNSGEGQKEAINMSKFMSQSRFKMIRSHVPFMCADESRKNTDPWWQIVGLIEAFNNNRKEVMQSGLYQVEDESMSGLRPRTTRTGNLPHLSMVARKPVPLGTEFKNIADTVTGIMLYLEIQRGKMPMREQPYTREHGGTTACTMRIAEGAFGGTGDKEEGDSKIILGDSWFASVNTCVQLQTKLSKPHRFVGIVKTAHSRYPKQWIQNKMKHWPAGSHIVLEGHASEGVKLSAIGYKYNKKKVICFIATDKSGHTEKGRPYKAKWIDDDGKKRSKNVCRPDICAKYFEYSNVIDTHNHIRQFETALERQWVTQDGYFRIITTIFGMTVTDTMKGYRHHLPGLHRHKHVSTRFFNDMLCKDMLNNAYPTTTERDLPVLIFPSESSTSKTTTGDDTVDSMSEISTSVAQSPLSAITKRFTHHHLRHSLIINPRTGIEMRGNRQCKRTKRGYCSVQRCRDPDHGRPQGIKTSYICSECSPQVFICGPTCLEIHRAGLLVPFDGEVPTNTPSQGWL